MTPLIGLTPAYCCIYCRQRHRVPSTFLYRCHVCAWTFELQQRIYCSSNFIFDILYVNFKIYSIIPKKKTKWGKLKLLHIVKYLLASLIPILLLASPFLSTFDLQTLLVQCSSVHISLFFLQFPLSFSRHPA